MKKHICFIKFLAIFLIIVIFALLLSIAVCSFTLHTSNYTVSLDSVTTPVHAVVISDLHGKEFGRENSRLIAKIEAQNPDVIFLVGDMIECDSDKDDVQRLLSFIEALVPVAPVYFSPGNHELEYIETDDTLLEQVVGAGAVVVNDSYVDVEIAGQTLRIGGTMGHGFPFGRTKEEFEASPEYVFLSDFENTDEPKICLAHMPDTFIFNGAYNYWDVDLVLSGHTHGGLIRIPFAGGLYAPMQEWFPEYDRGYFLLGGRIQMIITSGFAGYKHIPRINNLPELAVVDIVPQK